MGCLIKGRGRSKSTSNFGNRGQVWIETVIYTLIGLTIIGLVLAVALPKINAKRDEVMIDQAIQAMGNIDDKISAVQRASSTRRIVDLEIGKGRVIIDVEEDSIHWVIESSYLYSEVGRDVGLGSNMFVLTEGDDPWTVTLKLNYVVDLQFEGVTTGVKEFDSAPTPYKLMIENTGKGPDGNIRIKLSVS